ncbi:DUF2147 domain-containing protein [Acidovorax sp. LjRoot118]|uniref:DUF2147 domain-containing protein n=1 Tax=unclassified Acidovorax TaxID=2684926 RepID=UPI00070E3E35|nr:DUF2147 domain-containing protein [Acidovorax sp. Root219]KRC29028.1 hypothetical protein ASE28_19040 [Acidovorax sp. Root219]
MTPQSATAFHLLAALTLYAALPPAGAQQAGAEARAPLGRWVTESGNLEVEVAPCSSGSATLCGKVVKVMANRSMAGPGQAGEFADKRPALGMTLLSGFKPSGANEHQGEIYNRENAKTYSATLTPVGTDQLRVHAYVGIALFGKTQVWRRPPPAGPAPAMAQQ